MNYANYIDNLLQMTIAFLPKIVSAIIILLIGWIVGRILGKYISKALDKIGLDNLLLKTAFGQTIEKSSITVVIFFDYVIRAFVYLIAIMAAADVLDIDFLSEYLQMIVAFIPSVIAFAAILIVGFLLIDFIADFLIKMGNVGDVQFMKPMISIMRVFLYVMVIILALTQLRVDLTIIYILIEPLAWGIGLGIGAAIAIIVGFGLKDKSPEILNNFMGKIKK